MSKCVVWTVLDRVSQSTVKEILSSVDRASRYACVIKTNLMHYLSSVHFVNQPLHVSGIFVVHNQEVYCIYTTIGTCFAFDLPICWPTDSQLKSTTRTNCWHNTYKLLCVYIIPPDDRLQICPKHVEVDWRNKLRINSASSWFLLHRYSKEVVLTAETCFISLQLQNTARQNWIWSSLGWMNGGR
jgi:hypothetical protein